MAAAAVEPTPVLGPPLPVLEPPMPNALLILPPVRALIPPAIPTAEPTELKDGKPLLNIPPIVPKSIAPAAAPPVKPIAPISAAVPKGF